MKMNKLGELGLITAFFIVSLLPVVFVMIKTDLVIRWQIGYYKCILKLIGFEADIRSTPLAITINRIWGIFMLFVVVSAFIAVVAAYFLSA